MTATRQGQRRRVVPSQVEPRLQERRSRVAGDRRRTRRRAGIALGSVVLAAGLVVGAAWSPLLDLDHLRVEGTSRLDADALARASGLARGDQMVQIDPAEVRSALLDVPGVRGATVHLEWPSTVRIQISEERPAVELHALGRRSVLSTTGRLLGPDLLGAEGLVPLHVSDDLVGEQAGSSGSGSAATPTGARGPEVSDDVLDAAMVLHRMNDRVRSQVGSATLEKGGLLSLELTDGARVEFGPLEAVPAKLGALEATLAQVAADCRKSIDVREPARVTVSRTCAGPPVSDGADIGVDGGTGTGAGVGADLGPDDTTGEVEG